MVIDKDTNFEDCFNAVYTFLMTLGYTDVVPLNYDEIGSSEVPLPYLAYDVELTPKSDTLRYSQLPEGVITVMCIADDKLAAIEMADIVDTAIDNINLDFTINGVNISEDYIREGVKAYYVRLRYQVSFDGIR